MQSTQVKSIQRESRGQREVGTDERDNGLRSSAS